jgi:hypothetical protein
MTGCTDCYKFNANEALEQVKIQAKQTAIDTGTAQAVYQEQNDYYYTDATTALSSGRVIICFLSAYS